MKLNSRYIPFFLLCGMLTFGQGQKDYQPAPENIQAREWFKEARFGLFVHWGVYSLLGDGEWVMNNQNIPIDAYEKLPAFFNPIDFNADELVQMAKDAGMKYITITSRHHDGFSMFDTEASTYNIVDSTPYGKDVLKQLADACRKEDIKLFFYYSLLDWHSDDYFPRGRTGTGIPGRGEGEWNKYIAFMKTQLRELLTNYGDIAGIWFDGHWDQKEWDGKKFGKLQVDWHYDEIYKLIHDLQPQCLIGNNHHLAPIEGEDFQMFEKDLPGRNTTGWGTRASDIGQLPLEVCETINGSWGFNLQDRKHKSRKELIHYIVKAAGYGSNLLLNVGPMPNGKIQEEHKASLKEIGKWMRENGETIYGTLAGPVAPTDKMAFTQKGKTIYLHILDQSNTVFLEDFDQKIESIKLFGDQTQLMHHQNEFGLLIRVPENKVDEVDTIVEINLK
ncbi:alpha-L-fucosidase [Lentiprolixibacter aurantiacus]|uniref:alpha-L-fucosidase n=1 Tax=Lentiprolixibacter aurantiacus TaxID=2993939 RepID=A0AAE3MKB0_9FLAO|nr:alpha-L-fucosidase [Lentiprolixibacter aurantiacus]MCX2718896.1 alpha-L-fucosidase [Lentiprolixibacter aurantiacus]